MRVFETVEPRLRRALMARYGFDAGREATAEALAWAWEHRERLPEMHSPLRYLYRVGQSRARRRKPPIIPFIRQGWVEPWVEPGLAAALRAISGRQRVAVVLVYAYDWTPAEVADLLNVKVTTVRTHLERGLKGLRSTLEVNS
jgi:DNA-directed RNA polymerase specialized sigma24 family protein